LRDSLADELSTLAVARAFKWIISQAARRLIKSPNVLN
jgi:hypothetical protein